MARAGIGSGGGRGAGGEWLVAEGEDGFPYRFDEARGSGRGFRAKQGRGSREGLGRNLAELAILMGLRMALGGFVPMGRRDIPQ